MSNKAVIAGALHHCSPSQISSHENCPAYWYADKVLGLRIDESEDSSTALGTKVHGELEDYVEKGIRPTHPSALLLIADSWFPMSGDSVVCETPRNYDLELRAAGVKLKGRIDLIDRRNPKRVGIVDYKTSKDPKKYGKTPDELARNVQLITYAEYIFTQPNPPDEVVLTHAYIQTKTDDDGETIPGYKLVHTTPMTRAEVADVYAALVPPAVERIKATAALEDFELVTKNLKFCNEYGGCQYHARCGVKLAPWTKRARAARYDRTPTPVLDYSFPSSTPTPLPGVPSMSLTEKLAARRATGINPPDAAKHPTDTSTTKTEALAAAAPTFTAMTQEDLPHAAPTFTMTLEEMAKAAQSRALDAALATRSTGGGETLIVYTPPPPTPETPPSTDLYLFVDCRPVKFGTANIQSLDEEIVRRSQPILEHYSKRMGQTLLDVREVEFGKGTSELFASFRRTPLVGAWACGTQGLGGAIVEVLSPMATIVVRGGR